MIMNLYGYEFQRESDLMHYGIPGMRWGVRRYQDKNGKLTAEGRRHLESGEKARGEPSYEYKVEAGKRYFDNDDQTHYKPFDDWYGVDEKARLEKCLETTCATDTWLKHTTDNYNSAHNKYADMHKKLSPLLKYAKKKETYLNPDNKQQYDYQRPVGGYTSSMAYSAYKNGDISKEEYYEILKLLNKEKEAFHQLQNTTDELNKARLDNRYAKEAYNIAKKKYEKTPMATIQKIKSKAKKAMSFIFGLFKKNKKG